MVGDFNSLLGFGTKKKQDINISDSTMNDSPIKYQESGVRGGRWGSLLGAAGSVGLVRLERSMGLASLIIFAEKRPGVVVPGRSGCFSAVRPAGPRQVVFGPTSPVQRVQSFGPRNWTEADQVTERKNPGRKT